jgi:hypothetical protein
VGNILFVDNYQNSINPKFGVCIYHQKNKIEPVSFVPVSHYIKKNKK